MMHLCAICWAGCWLPALLCPTSVHCPALPCVLPGEAREQCIWLQHVWRQQYKLGTGRQLMHRQGTAKWRPCPVQQPALGRSPELGRWKPTWPF